MFGFSGLYCDERPCRIADEISLVVMIIVSLVVMIIVLKLCLIEIIINL